MEDIFDTVYSYQEYTSDNTAAKKHFKESESLLQNYNDLFDIYNTYDGMNNLKTINDNAGIQPVVVDPSIIKMLKLAKDFYDYSNGEFDITMGALLKVWHTYREEGIKLNEEGKQGNLPTDEELNEAASHRGWENVVIDEEKNTVYIADPEESLDVGGVAKGYAAELTASTLEDDGMTSGFLNVGRNIRLVGTKPGDTPWSIGIADPSGESSSGLLSIASASPVSVVTSGDYERYYTASDGKKYPHIIDPQTLYPADDYHSVTIITKDSGAADCLSTALFTLSIEEGKTLLKTYTEKTGNDAEAVWVMDPDKTQAEEGKTVGSYYAVYTDGLEGEITWAS